MCGRAEHTHPVPRLWLRPVTHHERMVDMMRWGAFRSEPRAVQEIGVRFREMYEHIVIRLDIPGHYVIEALPPVEVGH